MPKLKRVKTPICWGCKKKMKPALECKNFVTGKWDEHSFKCETCTPGLILSVG